MKYILFIIFLLLSNIGLAQIQHTEIEKSYVDGEKIFWNKKLPIYITLSSPNLDGVMLKKPFYLDTEGINYLRTKWEMDSTGKYVYPFGEQIWKIYADSKAPKTKVNFISKETYVFRGKRYYGDDLKIELVGEDELSGVDKIYYSINGKNFTLYENFIIFEAGIDIDLKFYSVDNVGNVEKISELSYDYDNNNFNFGIDNSPPKTYIGDVNILLSPNDVINLISEDIDGVGVNSTYYNFDSTEFIKYIEPIKLNKLNDGEHILWYFSNDWINNKENENIFEFYLDAIPPEIFVNEEIIKNELTNLRKITLTAIDNKSGVSKIMVQLNNVDKFKEYTKPFFIDITDQELKIKVIDVVGNERVRIVKYNEIK